MKTFADVVAHSSRSASGCLEYDGFRDKGGYGRGSINGRRGVTLSRFALEHKLGRPIAPGMWALHTCDNPACVEPEHLYEGNAWRNSRDAIERGRASPPPVLKGEKAKHSKLTAEIVRFIRSQLFEGCAPSDLARFYGVSATNIRYIRSGKIWGHV